MASLHQRPFSAADVGSVFSTGVGMPGRAAVGVEVSKKNVFVKLDGRQNKNKRPKSNSQRVGPFAVSLVV